MHPRCSQFILAYGVSERGGGGGGGGTLFECLEVNVFLFWRAIWVVFLPN